MGHLSNGISELYCKHIFISGDIFQLFSKCIEIDPFLDLFGLIKSEYLERFIFV